MKEQLRAIKERRTSLIKLYFSDIPKIFKIQIIGAITELDFWINATNNHKEVTLNHVTNK